MMKRLLRFTLDLFQPEPVATAGEPASAAEMPDSEQKMPFTLTGVESIAIKNIANSKFLLKPPVPPNLQQALNPAGLRHPRSTREALLDGKLVGYEIKRRKRRTIGFSVGAEGLAVSAPKWVPLYEIDRAVQCKSSWILKKLHETRERSARHEAARIEWKDGAIFPFLGQPVTLRVDSLCAHTALHSGVSAATDALPDQTLHLALPGNATDDQIRNAVRSWLQLRAMSIFTERLNHFMPRLGVQWRKLSLSSAATRWGSASASGAIRLNWRLLHFSLPVIDYVVVHELSHLRVMDHSPRFWAVVGEVIPHYAALRQQLKGEAVARW